MMARVQFMPTNNDVLAGILFIAIGLIFGIYIFSSLDIGSPQAMGPGFFPFWLAGLLVIFGAVIALRGERKSDQDAHPVAWRGLVTLTASTVLFGLAVDPFGLVPALAISILLATGASGNMGVRRALAVTLGLVLICLVVFYWMLGTPLQLFGPWLHF